MLALSCVDSGNGGGRIDNLTGVHYNLLILSAYPVLLETGGGEKKAKKREKNKGPSGGHKGWDI